MLPVCCRLRELSNLGWLLHLEKLFVGMNRIQVRVCVCNTHSCTRVHMYTHAHAHAM